MLGRTAKAALAIIGLALVLAATHVLASISVTIYFEAFVPSGSTYSFVNIPVSGGLTCNGATTSFTSQTSVSCTSSSNVYIKVTSLPSGYWGGVYDASVKAWSFNYNYTISSSGTYYLIVATPYVSVNNPPNSNLPYYGVVLNLQSALVTSLPSNIYPVAWGTGELVRNPTGWCCTYQPPFSLGAPYYYLTSSGTYASGTSVVNGPPNQVYGFGYYAIYSNILEPILVDIPSTYYYQFELPGYGLSYPGNPSPWYGIVFYSPPPSGWYDNYYIPSSSSSYSENQPLTIQVQFTVIGSTTSGTLLGVGTGSSSASMSFIWFSNSGGNNYVNILLGGTCSGYQFQVSQGNTYTIQIIINPSHTNPISIFINGVNETTTSLWTCGSGNTYSYLWIGDGNFGPLQGVAISYVAIWQDQASTSPSGAPTFLFTGIATNDFGVGPGDVITVYPGWPIYVWTGSSAVELYTGSSFNYNLTYPQPPPGTDTAVDFGGYIGPFVATNFQNPVEVLFTTPNGGTFSGWCGAPTVYVQTVSGLIDFKYPFTASTGIWWYGYPSSTIALGSGDFAPTGVQMGTCSGASVPSNVPVFYIPNLPPAQTNYMVIPVQPGSGSSQPLGTYIGHSLVPSLTFNVLTINYPCSTSPPSTLDSTSLAYYFSNGTLFVSGSITPVNPVFFDTSPTGYLLWNNTFIVIPGLMQYEPGISSIAIADSDLYTSITLDLGTASGGSVAWAPLIAIQGVIGSGQLAFGGIFQSIGMEGSYYSYTIQVPSCALGKPAMVYVYSYKTTSFTNLTVTLQNPLYLVLSGEGVTTPPIATASATVTVNVVTPPPTSKPFILPPPSLNAQVMFLLPFAAASLIILMVRKHASLMAGLMLAGLVTIAVGVVLGIVMMFAAGILMFIIGAAWAMAWRKQP